MSSDPATDPPADRPTDPPTVQMATVLGEIGAYDPAAEEWPNYVERLEGFFDANGITAPEKKRSVFIAVVGPKSYNLLKNLVAPTKPKEKTLDELLATLTQHYRPTPSEVMQRFRFNTRTRKEGESVADYLAALRQLAEFCNFGDTLEKMLRDRLVCGIGDEPTQKKLLAETNLTYEKALQIARGSEAAAKNLREMKSPLTPPATVKTEPVHRVSKTRRTTPPKAKADVTCHRCGTPGHIAPDCPYKDLACHECGKEGHLAKVCKNKHAKQPSRKPSRKPPRGKTRLSRKAVLRVEDESDSEDDLDAEDYGIRRIQAVSERTTSMPPIKIKVEVDECLVGMEVDTGAAMSIMAINTFRKLWPRRSLDKTAVKLQNYSGESIPVLGMTSSKVTYEGQQATLPLMTLDLPYLGVTG